MCRGAPALLFQRRLQFLQERICGEADALSPSVQFFILVSRRGCQWTHPHQQTEECSYADSDTTGGVTTRSLVTWLRGQADLGGTTL
jgi:hypothetical protein